MASTDPVAERLQEAANWFTQLEDGVADTAAFERWRAVPENAIAFNRVSRSAHGFDSDKHRLPDSYMDNALTAVPNRRGVLMGGVAVLGASLIGVGTYVAFNPPRAMAQTRVGGRSLTPLPDGSRLDLNTDSKVYWRFNDRTRDVWLEKGEMGIQVVDDPRPLRILSSEGKVSINAGEALVRRQEDHIALTVFAGKASVAISSEAPLEMNAGQQVVVATMASGLYTLSAEQLDAAKAWQRDEIVFLGEPLGQAVAEYNRYLTRKIVLSDDGVSEIKLGGRFGMRQSARTPRFFVTTSISALVLSSALCFGSGSLAETAKRHYDIPAETAAKALVDLSRQATIQISFPYEFAEKHNVPAINGEYSLDEILTKIITGTGLEVASSNDNLISLRVAVLPLASVVPDEEIIVTGTRIRKSQPASPIHTVTRNDIERSGYANMSDLVRSLPEAFTGGQNPGVVGAGGSMANTNFSDAATVNLRGLGTDATLVLVNGHRLSGDGYFQGSDISGIPMAAIDRVEVLTDGASALYGSDAVAGVANFILSKSYDGGQLTLTGGETAQGGGAEKSASLLLGRARSTWHLLGNFEYYDREAITAGQRKITSEAYPDITLLRPQTRKSVYLAGGVDVNDALSVDVDFIASDRRSSETSAYSSSSFVTEYQSYSPSYSASVSVDGKLRGDWKYKVSAVGSGSRDETSTVYPQYNYTSSTTYQNDLSYIEASADGTALSLPSGPLKVAAGLGYRREHMEASSATSVSFTQDGHREVSYLFAEANAPLVSPSPTRAGLHSLDLNVSLRTEHYSDFGSTTNPRIGLRYVPLDGLNIRGTWGTSFKAPTFNQLNQAVLIFVYDANLLGYSGSGQGLITNGGNSTLLPEKSTSWTLGADYSPPPMKSMVLSATYFDIDYRDRVVRPIDVLGTGLSNPIYAPFVQYNPSSSDVDNLAGSTPYFYDYSSTGYDPSAIVAILNDQDTNATGQTVKGLDLSYRQTFQFAAGVLMASANGTWMELRQQTIETLPVVKLSGTLFYPPSYKARAGLTWQTGNWDITGIANYVSGEEDTGVTPAVEVASFTTVDATLTYRLRQLGAKLSNSRLTLAASNLFDKTPPRTESSNSIVPGLYYDSTNHSVVGREVRLTLSASW